MNTVSAKQKISAIDWEEVMKSTQQGGFNLVARVTSLK